MYQDDAIKETMKDLLVDTFPSELKKLVKAHEKNRMRLEKENRQIQTQVQFNTYQKETEQTLNEVLEHSIKIKESLDNEKAKRENSERKAYCWQIVSIILGIISIVLAALSLKII